MTLNNRLEELTAFSIREASSRVLHKGFWQEMCFPESLKEIKGLGTVRRKLVIDILTSEEPVRQERKVRR